MPEESVNAPKLSLRSKLTRSSILRIGIALLLFTFYYIIISPKVEAFISNNLSERVRGISDTHINSLTPVFDIHVYAGEYNLSSDSFYNSSESRTKFFTMDPRILAMNKFLINYHSPMANDAKVFIVEADRYGLDWRLVASISGVEGAFGNLVPQGSNNSWGWRGINGNSAGWSMFPTWADAITHVTERLALGYGTGLTPFDIEATYCPPCGANPEHVWANGVNRFMNQLQYYVDNLENL